ncbi:putative phosphoribosyl transferase [Salinihabitans flavidus]|uniref:Putative phosphoribosyl transferase n=1 Tax=Salinihabitans flavidus TaxID=569882 RepID=A0A1H8S928_9RHOB|nr:phosphoribosyltransferase family protein [Salinihabitans flavidus]SEO75559.1 putative phosphoribosyl transferase [Salinihabitans flavidus]
MFQDRTNAGERLATELRQRTFDSPVVLALPRGGVPVALPVAQALAAPLDLLLVRKLGLPGHAEYAAGAVVEDAATVFNDDVLRAHGLTRADFADAIAEKRRENAARRAQYFIGREPVPLDGQDAIVVDDGIATGATVRAALRGLKSREPARVILAVPVAPADTLEALRPLVDEVICLATPHPFYAVGVHYADFPQVRDDEVAAMLRGTNGQDNEEGDSPC